MKVYQAVLVGVVESAGNFPRQTQRLFEGELLYGGFQFFGTRLRRRMRFGEHLGCTLSATALQQFKHVEHGQQGHLPQGRLIGNPRILIGPDENGRDRKNESRGQGRTGRSGGL